MAESQKGHEFSAARFHVPTWCSHCRLFVKSPFGKQGFSCGQCHHHIHKNCFDAASKTACLPHARPSRVPHKMLGAMLTDRKEKVAAIEAIASNSPLNKKVLQQMIGDLQSAAPGRNLHHITKDSFVKVLPKYFRGPIDSVQDLLFEMCEGDDGTADVKDVIGVLALLSAGNPSQKLELLFRMYDANEDGMLTEGELKKMCAFFEVRVTHWLSDDEEYLEEAIASVRALQETLLEDEPDGVALASWLSEAAKFRTVQPLLERLQVPAAQGVLGYVARQIRYPSFDAWMKEHTPAPLFEENWDEVLTTGSVMLAAGGEAVSKLIMKSTWSTWSHAALIIRDPPADVRAKYGVDANERFFVFESDTVTFDNRKGGGVQLVPLKRWLEVEMEDCKVDGRAVVRVLKLPNVTPANEWVALSHLREFMLEVHGEAYKKSKFQLAGSAVRANKSEDLTSIFCSELVAAALRHNGLLGAGRNANNYLPKDFESGSPSPLPLLKSAVLLKEQRFFHHKPKPVGQ